MLVSVRGFTPQIGLETFIAPSADIIGDVVIGAKSSVWYNTTLRGDVMPIRIGEATNIQDGVVIHGTFNKFGVTLHNRVTVGHLAMLHGCEVDDNTLIGMHSLLMDGSRVGKNCIVGAGTLIVEGSQFEDGVLILGRPGKVIRKLTQDELKNLNKSADNYLMYKEWYK